MQHNWLTNMDLEKESETLQVSYRNRKGYTNYSCIVGTLIYSFLFPLNRAKSFLLSVVHMQTSDNTVIRLNFGVVVLT